LRAVAIVLLAMLGAGCLSPNAPAATHAEKAPAAAPALLNNSTVQAPVWRVGDAWTATSKNGASSEHVTFVVTAASSDAYTLATTSPTLAGYDAMFDISYLGKIRASDLAGGQHGNPVAFFAFPMRDGAAWSTTWDGQQATVVATYAPAIPTAGGQPGFTLVASVGGKPYATYDYVPALKWWSHLDFAAGYGLAIDGARDNWTGAIATATAKEVFNSTTVFPVATLNTQTFHVDDRQTFVSVQIQGGAKGYARAYQLVDPNGTAYPSGGPATDAQPSGGFAYDQAQYPALAGDWKISAPAAHTNDGYFALVAHEVAVSSRPFP
jgi:hypothetical protein